MAKYMSSINRRGEVVVHVIHLYVISKLPGTHFLVQQILEEYLSFLTPDDNFLSHKANFFNVLTVRGIYSLCRILCPYTKIDIHTYLTNGI